MTTIISQQVAAAAPAAHVTPPAGGVLQERRKILGGALWSAVDFWLQQTSQFFTFVVVGNLLGPASVGVMTMGLTAIMFAWAFINGGFADTLIQRVELRKDHFDTTFWLLIGIALAGMILLVGGAPLLARTFKEQELTTILPLLALSLPFIAITSSYQALIQRELRFKQLALRSMVASTLGFAVAVAAAKLGFGIYSLVAYYLVTRFLEAFLVVLVTRKLPGMAVTRAALADIVDYGKHRVGNQVSGILLSQVPRIVIGIFLNSFALGLYSIVERILAALQNGVSGVVARVAFPTLSGRQRDEAEFFRAMRDFITAGNVIMLPTFVGLSITSHEAIRFLMSESWAGAAPILAILCLGMLVQPSFYVIHTGAIALGHSRDMSRLSLFNLLLCLVASVIAAPHGTIAVAWANAGVNLSTMVLVWAATRKFYRGRWLYLLAGSTAPALATACMAAATLLISQWVGSQDLLLMIAVKVGVGVSTYLVALRLIGPKAFRGLLDLALNRKAVSPTAA